MHDQNRHPQHDEHSGPLGPGDMAAPSGRLGRSSADGRAGTEDEHAATWRDQLIELSLPGLGMITASADPLLLVDPGSAGDAADWPDPADGVDDGPWDDDGMDFDGMDEDGWDEDAFRRRPPTSPPEPERVRRTLRERPPLELEHTWLVVPALGPVLPSTALEGTPVGDLSGRRSPMAPRTPAEEPAVRPSREGLQVGAPGEGGRRPPLSPRRGWFRLPAVAAALRARGGMVGRGALVGTRRDWFEPAVAVREDLLAAHPDQALESALAVAREFGQPAAVRIGPRGLDVIPTGTDPRVPLLEGLPVLVTARPIHCPLQGEDCEDPCRPVGGPWIRASQAAQIEWEARRSQALAVQGCGVCFGEALPPEPDQPQTPRLSRAVPVADLDRLHLRGGEVVRIDPLAGNR